MPGFLRYRYPKRAKLLTELQQRLERLPVGRWARLFPRSKINDDNLYPTVRLCDFLELRQGDQNTDRQTVE